VRVRVRAQLSPPSWLIATALPRRAWLGLGLGLGLGLRLGLGLGLELGLGLGLGLGLALAAPRLGTVAHHKQHRAVG
jgi:hypothetical protein